MTIAPSARQGPLDGIRVIEYGVFHAGPGAAAILGDLGADVIKIEAGIGDPERFWMGIGTFSMAKPNGESFMFDVSNRNKRSVKLDIKTEKGQDIFHKLIGGADVFLTNLRSTTKQKLRIDYPSIVTINQNIIYASVSGYGQHGPLKDMGAFDPLGLARSGMTFLTGSKEPKLIHLGVLDQATAIAASHAIMTALFVRERKGWGQEVHVSLYSTGMWLIYADLMLTNALGVDPTDSGDRLLHSPLRNVFKCKDNQWIIGTHHPEEKYWTTFLKAMGQEHLENDRRFSDPDSRKINNPELIGIFDQVFSTRKRDDWMDIFVQNGLMFNPVQTIPEIQHDDQALANRYMVPFEQNGIGHFMIPGYPIDFSKNVAGTKKLSPDLGAHTDEVLLEAGYTREELAVLRAEGIIG